MKRYLLTILVSMYLGAGMCFGGLALLFGLLANQPVWKDVLMTIYATLAWPALLFCNGLCPFPGWWNF